MKKMNKWVIVTILLCLLLPYKAFADVAVGDMIVTLGENLTNEQKNMLLSEMNAPNDVQTITVYQCGGASIFRRLYFKSLNWNKSHFIFCYYI